MAINLTRARSCREAAHDARNAGRTDDGTRARSGARDCARAGVIARAHGGVGADLGTHGGGVHAVGVSRVPRVAVRAHGVLGAVSCVVGRRVGIRRLGFARAAIFRVEQHVRKRARGAGQNGRACEGRDDEEASRSTRHELPAVAQSFLHVQSPEILVIGTPAGCPGRSRRRSRRLPRSSSARRCS